MKTTRREFLAAGAVFPATGLFESPTLAPRLQSQKYRACIIGATGQGDYGHNLHTVFGLRSDVDMVALADPDEGGRRSHAAEIGVARTYADYHEMLTKERPDLVVIAPRYTVRHREYLLAAAETGAHGLMEKPIADNVSDGDDMVKAITGRNLKWAVAYNFRAMPSVQHARRLIIDEGLIGQILEVRGRGKEDRRAGGEDMLVLGIHITDLMRFFLGEPLWCEADVTVDGRPARRADVHEATESLGPVAGDSIQATYAFKNGVKGYFASTRSGDGNGGRWGLDIFGSRGIVAIRPDARPITSLLREPSWAPFGRNRNWEPLPGAPAEVESPNPRAARYAPIVDDLLLAMKENREPKVNLRDGLLSLEMLQAVYESHIREARVTFPLKNRAHPLKKWD
ncbi:MAG: gfo/Idh/MocA family oxidoreductase [Acidobacteria bacterium]|nr:MAG: gfo/Idh/MocA family oxidoreductase [Acidobacteriota bacterium]